ncbi:metal ABC transporter substrate-binding protein [Aeromicrobium sp. Leaf350]|uniref:metal ABC transporter substrate-binding protein n=1 Tax=Aeromicrobium sp. Leaf350 TaxID=2876565 RepID=UPI001E4EF256|nr:metal ABC transporter substrate-binding protein [Aeromicrobium sp. Leaf350]
MRRAALIAPALLLLSPLLVACGDGSGDDGPTVVTSAYPFQFLVERVAGDYYAVENLTRPGAEAHDLELSPRQVADVQGADLVVYVEHFQAALDEAVEQADREDDTTVDLATVVDLLEADEESHEGHDHGDEEEGHKDHDHGGVDPHFWLDPHRMELAARAIGESLAEIDPDHADDYTANAEELVTELQTLDADFTVGLQNCELRTIVTAHSAFGYLADAYDLTQIPIAGLEPSAEPSSAQLAEISDLVTSAGVTTVFTEELVDPRVAETVANATGATTAILDPIEGLSEATADEDYLSLMRNNLDAIREANRCQ